jgi:phosphoribosylamine--glycine ligase
MKVLVIGSGGREHALVWKISQSKKIDKIYCAPGNAGIAELAECINIKSENIPELKKFAIDQKIDLTIVGPEAPLAAGIVDEFKKDGLKIFGPSKAAARLEGSKIYAKEIMKKYDVPTGLPPAKALLSPRILRRRKKPYTGCLWNGNSEKLPQR